MVETLSELLENAANVAEDNGGKLSIASAVVEGIKYMIDIKEHLS